MGIDAKGLVLMKRENGILGKELGSYEIHEGLELVFKAYVEDNLVKLFVTTDRDVTDEEYNEVFDEYEQEELIEEGFEVEEVEEEFNPVWCITLEYKEDDGDMEEDLNFVLSLHRKQIAEVFEKLKRL